MTHSTQTATRTVSTVTMPIVNAQRLRWARAIWVVLVAVNTLYGLANWLVYTSLRLQPCAPETCLAMQIPTNAAVYFAQNGIPFAAAALVRPIFEAILVTIYTGVGIVLFRRRSDDWMGMLSGLTLCLLGFQLTYSIETLPVLMPQTLPISLLLSLSMSFAAYTSLYLFPIGRVEPRWTAYLLILTLVYEVPRGVFINLPELGINPGQMLYGTLILCGAGLWLQVWRFKRLAALERQQVKWVILAFLWLIAGMSLSAVQRVVIPNLEGTTYVISSLLAVVVQHVMYLALPIAFAFSMLRYRLWDADLVINKTLVYISSSIALVVITYGLFLALNALLVNMVGQQSPIPLVISLVTAIFLFPIVSSQLARLIDRQIYGLRVELSHLDTQSGAETYFIPTTDAKTGKYTGFQVGVYVLRALLGKGAMSEVYTAQDALNGQMVALKLLPAEMAAQGEALARFQRESKALARLNAPNIVQMVSNGMSGGLHYLALEWVGQQTLSDRLTQDLPMSFDEAFALIGDIAAALDASHAAGVIHRDVKPSNILLRSSGSKTQAVLTDFGVAKLTDEDETNEHHFVGTPYYAAPEQITTSTAIDHRADIYALGIVAYQMLTGRHPFKVSPAAVVFAHLNRPPTDPHFIRPDLSKSARQALFKALAKNPDARYDSAGAFAAALAG